MTSVECYGNISPNRRRRSSWSMPSLEVLAMLDELSTILNGY
jgi:hypothetical protein